MRDGGALQKKRMKKPREACGETSGTPDDDARKCYDKCAIIIIIYIIIVICFKVCLLQASFNSI